MWFDSTCCYPLDEVRTLVEFAMAEIDHSQLAVRVKNTRDVYRGRAYDGLPSLSAANRVPGMTRLVTIGIGPPSGFPTTNEVRRARWRKVRANESLDGVRKSDLRVSPSKSVATTRSRVKALLGLEPAPRLERREVRTHGYGGVTSPIVSMTDWREALVAVAAHEARHVWQYQHDAPRSEVDAERYSDGRLALWREWRAWREGPVLD
ncbi:MAG: hypothetical protein EXR66_02065 [Dehalococcoidia bacterium]|nr:hypothetical protein [Dehalococcoidia bacterium]